jgi:hypothetical protein
MEVTDWRADGVASFRPVREMNGAVMRMSRVGRCKVLPVAARSCYDEWLGVVVVGGR